MHRQDMLSELEDLNNPDLRPMADDTPLFTAVSSGVTLFHQNVVAYERFHVLFFTMNNS